MNAVPSGPSEPDNKRAPVEAGGGPPHDGGTERRLTVLETRFDTILPMLATKADLAELRLDMEKLGKEVHGTLTKAMMWFGALAMTITFGMVGFGIYLSNQVTSQVSNQVRIQIDQLSARLPRSSSVAPMPDRSAASTSRPALRSG